MYIPDGCGRDSVGSISGLVDCTVVVHPEIEGSELSYESTAVSANQLHRAIRQGENDRVKELLATYPEYIVESIETVEPRPLAERKSHSFSPALAPLLRKVSSCQVQRGTGVLTECAKRPIHIAAEVDNLEATKLLLQNNADMFSRQRDYYALQPMHIACANGSTKVLDFLLSGPYGDKAALVECEDKEGSTPLHYAVMHRNVHCVELLLRAGASVNHCQRTGLKANPLHLACGSDTVDMTEKILRFSNAQYVEQALEDLDAKKQTPLMDAVATDNHKVLAVFISKGVPLNVVDSDGCNLLHQAAAKAAWKSFTLLLAAGLDPFQRGSKDCTAIHHATKSEYDFSVCKETGDLIQKLENWQENVDVLDEEGLSALHHSVSSGNLKVTQGLLHLGANVRKKSSKMMTCLHYVARYGHTEVAGLLLKFPGISDSVNDRDYKGRTALHLAASHGHTDIIEMLDNCGKTPLHYASAGNHHRALKVILNNSPQILNYEDDHDHFTALHMAAKNDAGYSVVFLLSGKANFASTKTGACTPLEIAILHKKENAALAFVNSAQWYDIIMEPSYHYETLVLGLIENLPNAMKACLNRGVINNPASDSVPRSIEYNFSILQPPKPRNQQSAEKKSPFLRSPLGTLKVMALHKNNDLLSHPLCTALLEQKWIIYGLYCSALILCSNMAFVGILAYVVTFSVKSKLRPHLKKLSYNNALKYRPELWNSSQFLELKKDFERDVEPFDPTAGLVLLCFAMLIILIKEIADFRSQRVRYFRDWTNYIEVALFATTIIFIWCMFRDLRLNTITMEVTYQSGALAIFLALFNMIRFCRPFGTFGLYSFMFFSVFKTLFQVAIFFFILTAAFTMSFYTLFQSFIFPDYPDFYDKQRELDTEELFTAHETLHTSGVRIASLMLGDLEAVERFLTPFTENMMPFPDISFVFYGLCLVLMSILLNNLLMGLSLADMATIRKNAVILRVQMQISLHESLERLFPDCWLEKIQLRVAKYRYYPDGCTTFATWLARFVSGAYNKEFSVPHTDTALEDLSYKPGPSDKSDVKAILRRLQETEAGMGELRQLLVQSLESRSEPNQVTFV